jgi:hypothetical protein
VPYRSKPIVTRRECGFPHTKGLGSYHMCEVNFVVSSITIICGVYFNMYYINIKNLTLSYEKYHTIYLFWAQMREFVLQNY